jgi:hypothetical protein
MKRRLVTFLVLIFALSVNSYSQQTTTVSNSNLF